MSASDNFVPWTDRENLGWAVVHAMGLYQTTCAVVVAITVTLDPAPAWGWVVASYTGCMVGISYARYCLGDQLCASHRQRRLAAARQAPKPEAPKLEAAAPC